MYSHKSESCIFCNIQPKRIVSENNLAFVIKDNYPVTGGHSLIIPKRHFKEYFEITQAEVNSINKLMTYSQQILKKNDTSIMGFNIGINCGEIAGQTIMHTHIHLIPRREKDVENPIGGIRNIITGKGKY